MARLTAIDPAKATAKGKELLDKVKMKLGVAPNLMRTMVNSPAVLEAYLNFSGALAGGFLSAGLRERIALAVAETNSCEYCLSAHTAIGKMVGLGDDEIIDSRESHSTDPRIDTALKFARTIVTSRGEVTDNDLNLVRDAGYTEGEIAEIIANVVLNIFTNYINHAAQTEIDFPKVAFVRKN